MKKEKTEKIHLICPKCKASSNSPDKTECFACKSSLEGAKSILVADDFGYLPNYISGSGLLFMLFGAYFIKVSLTTSLYFTAATILMCPIILRKISQKLKKKHPGIIIRTILATALFLTGVLTGPSQKQIEAKEEKDLREATVAAVVRANEQKAAKKAAEQEEKQRQISEEKEAAKKADEKKVKEETNKPKRSEKELLSGFKSNINDANLAQFIESYSVNKSNIDQLEIVVTNDMFTVDKQIRLQFVQKLWQLWSDICFFNVKDIDSCRIKVRDIMGNTVAESSVWGGSIVKLKD